MSTEQMFEDGTDELYPEHRKLDAVKDRSQAIGEFLENCGYRLCRWTDAQYEEGEFLPVGKTTQQVLAEYFDVDLNLLEEEKRAMLDRLRKESS